MPRKPPPPTNRRYTPEERSAAVLDVMRGETILAVSNRLSIPYATLSWWVSKAGGVRQRSMPDPTITKAHVRVPADKIHPVGGGTFREYLGKDGEETVEVEVDLDDLAQTLVVENFRAIFAILRQSQDPAWLRQQNAKDLAILLGVSSDKLYRLLIAVAGGAQQPDEQEQPEPNVIATVPAESRRPGSRPSRSH